MHSPLRLFCLLPIILFALIAIIQLLLGNFLFFVLWEFITFLIINVCLPIVIKANEKHLPIYQIFSILIAFTVTAIFIVFFDLQNYLPTNKAMVLSIILGTGITGLILFLGGYNSRPS